MKRRRMVQLAALGGLTLPLAGCTEEAADPDGSDPDNETSDETDEDATDDDRDDEDAEDESTDEPDEQEFSGSGDDAVEDVSIEGGFTVVDATHGGEDDFEVRLIPEAWLAEDDEEADDVSEDEEADDADDDGDEDGEDGDAPEGGDDEDDVSEEEGDDEDGAESVSFVTASGEYEGQTAHPVDEGTYVLSVVADGDWEVAVLQPRAESGDEPPISVSGDGNEVHGPFEFDGSHQPSGEYDGERIVSNVYSPTGDTTAFVFHEGSIEDPAEFEFDGVGYLAVKSDGEWSVEID